MKTVITPTMASEILSRNTVNRIIKNQLVYFIARQIENGEFVYNGESIIISTDGTLIDGQHRLLACIMANLPITVELVEGIDITVMPTINTGIPRGLKDVFAIKGVSNSKVASGVTRSIMDEIKTNRRKYNGKGGYVNDSNIEVLDFYYKHDKMIDSLSLFSKQMNKIGYKILSPQYIGAFVYLMSFESDDDNILKFIRELMTGVTLSKSNAAQVLRKKMISDRIGRVSHPLRYKVSSLIKAFRSYNKDENISRIVIGSKEFLSFVDHDEDEEPIINYEYMKAHSGE